MGCSAGCFCLWKYEDALLDKVHIFSSTYSMTLLLHPMSTDLLMLCFLHHLLIQSLSRLIIAYLAFSHKIILVSLYLGPLVNNILYFYFSNYYFYMLVIFVYKTKACAVTWQNSIFLKKGFNIKIRNKFIKIKYFEPDWIGKRVYESRIIKLDIGRSACFDWWIMKK